MSFFLKQTSITSRARRGVLRTPHGELQTPFFMPIATRGAVKTLSSMDVERLGSPILLSNTYHLYLRPGIDVLRSVGGLHRFMSWNGAVLTDSGGYQVFSLSDRRKIREEGAEFASHIDGSKHLLTPELSMDVQQAIGSDIAMVLDECTPAGSTEAYLTDSLDRTLRWAERSKTHFQSNLATSNNPGAQLFGIVQGGTSAEMRIKHAQSLMNTGFDGYALGGLSVGEPFEAACETVAAVDRVLPIDQPRYFMGGAQPHEIVAYVQRGIDMFDCVLPTRNARHGMLYRFCHDRLTEPGFYEAIHVTNEKWKTSDEPLVAFDPASPVTAELSRYSMAYVRHLFSVEEVLGARLLTLANLHFYLTLMKKLREGIEKGEI